MAMMQIYGLMIILIIVLQGMKFVCVINTFIGSTNIETCNIITNVMVYFEGKELKWQDVDHAECMVL